VERQRPGRAASARRAGVPSSFFGFPWSGLKVYSKDGGQVLPNTRDGAPNSDVTPTFSDDLDSVARSEVFEVTIGGEAVVDVGLTELAAA
jgi:hypothetical protein